ncbi:unnamed protein product [Ostreobium quekettii]|uniref:J domain-containing protein n=1 Tax=Ostreobium quekettii TaxID=121088 RepID=A0A8S1JAP7_9CHLO|nr:unnamed protein product [Ostreobium quekettii]
MPPEASSSRHTQTAAAPNGGSSGHGQLGPDGAATDAPAPEKIDLGSENGAERGDQGQKEAAGNGGPSGVPAPPDEAGKDDLLREFFMEMRAVDRDNEVDRILGTFKLNPFEQLLLRFDAGPEEVRRQYRKLSLMVHPDKCSHPRAREAFEVLGEAHKLLLDGERREQLDFALGVAREEIRKERRKSTKHDAAVRVAIALHEEGRAGVEAVYEATDEFHEKWKAKARDVLARTEWRRRNLAKRIKDETNRIEEEEKTTKAQLKRVREHKETWEKTRDERVGTWRDYLKSGGKKKKKKGMTELRPPKIKTNDEDKLYVQRPVGEQFRPPQSK